MVKSDVDFNRHGFRRAHRYDYLPPTRHAFQFRFALRSTSFFQVSARFADTLLLGRLTAFTPHRHCCDARPTICEILRTSEIIENGLVFQWFCSLVVGTRHSRIRHINKVCTSTCCFACGFVYVHTGAYPPRKTGFIQKPMFS